MGLLNLRGTETYEYIRTCIPRDDEIKVAKIHDDYKVSMVSRNMDLLGTMCDYGVRSYYPMREYAYLELSMIVSGVDEILDALLSQFCLDADDAYYLCAGRDRKMIGQLNSTVVRDYDNLVHRAIELYNCFNLQEPCFGRYYTIGGVVKAFECDCVDKRMVIDMKLTNNVKHNKGYWAQVLLYSFLAKMVDGVTRNTIGLVLPVQGEIRWFTYPKDQYYGVFVVFKDLYEREVGR